MPLVKIELSKGNEKAYLLQLKSTVMDCVQKTLKLPENDTNIRLIEYEPDFFTMKEPYTILLEVTLFSGRSKETKANLYKTIVNTLCQKIGVVKESVFIVLNEQPLVNWGVRGGIPADEIKLDYMVNI